MTPVTPLDATDTWGDLLVSLPEPSPASLSTSGSMSSGEYSSLFDVGTIAGGAGFRVHSGSMRRCRVRVSV
jgi:hypothetical protein